METPLTHLWKEPDTKVCFCLVSIPLCFKTLYSLNCKYICYFTDIFPINMQFWWVLIQSLNSGLVESWTSLITLWETNQMMRWFQLWIGNKLLNICNSNGYHLLYVELNVFRCWEGSNFKNQHDFAVLEAQWFCTSGSCFHPMILKRWNKAVLLKSKLIG